MDAILNNDAVFKVMADINMAVAFRLRSAPKEQRVSGFRNLRKIRFRDM